MKQIPENLSILFVCSGNFKNIQAFILEQQQGLQSSGVKVDLFKIVGRGVGGYLKNFILLVRQLKSNHYDLIHAHFGLSGLLACLQSRVPVVVTMHGSDVFLKKNRLFSKLATLLARRVVIVNEKMRSLLPKKDLIFIPCGVDTDLFRPMMKHEARNKLGGAGKYTFEEGVKYVLFSSSFNKEVKNPTLAIQAIKELGSDYRLIELKNFSREEVMWLMNAVDLALLTSHSEGSPQFIKEAMACNRPIVSTDVGDVKELFSGISGCIVVDPNQPAVINGIRQALNFESTSGRDVIEKSYRNDLVIEQLITVYQDLI